MGYLCGMGVSDDVRGYWWCWRWLFGSAVRLANGSEMWLVMGESRYVLLRCFALICGFCVGRLVGVAFVWVIVWSNFV